jgi:hypothetical protein
VGDQLNAALGAWFRTVTVLVAMRAEPRLSTTRSPTVFTPAVGNVWVAV